MQYFSASCRLRTPDDPLPNPTTELFIDLITSASFSSLRFLNANLATHTTGLTDLQRSGIFAGLFGPFWFSSWTTMLYQNRFLCNDQQFKLYLLVCMIIVILMAVYVADCDKNFQEQQGGRCLSVLETQHVAPVYAVLSAALFMVVGFQYLKPYREHYEENPSVRTFCRIQSCTCLLAAGVWWVIFFVLINSDEKSRWHGEHSSAEVGLVTLLSGLANLSNIVFLLVDPLSKYLFGMDYGTVDNEVMKVHFNRRIAKFMIMVLSQAVSAIIIPQDAYTPSQAFFAVNVLFSSYLFKFVYFDMDFSTHNTIAQRHLMKRVRTSFKSYERSDSCEKFIFGLLFNCCTFMLAMSITLFGGGAKNYLQRMEVDEDHEYNFRRLCWSLAGSIAMSGVLLALLRSKKRLRDSRRRKKCVKATRMLTRLAFALVVACLPFMGLAAHPVLASGCISLTVAAMACAVYYGNTLRSAGATGSEFTPVRHRHRVSVGGGAGVEMQSATGGDDKGEPLLASFEGVDTAAEGEGAEEGGHEGGGGVGAEGGGGLMMGGGRRHYSNV